MKEKQREELVMKSVESIVQDNGKQAPRFVTCTTKGCPGEGKVFGNGGAFARHLNSAQHTDAFDAAFKRGKKRPQRLQTPERVSARDSTYGRDGRLSRGELSSFGERFTDARRIGA